MTIQSGGGAALATGYFRAGLQPATSTAASVTDPTKTVRETEAEAVAFVVSRAVGMDTNTAASDYIQLYAGDQDTPAAPLDRIQHTATRIISVILGEGKTGEHRQGRRHRDRGRVSEPRVATDLVDYNVLYNPLSRT